MLCIVFRIVLRTFYAFFFAMLYLTFAIGSIQYHSEHIGDSPLFILGCCQYTKQSTTNPSW